MPKKTSVMVTFILLCPFWASLAATPPDGDDEKLQGTWTIVSFESLEARPVKSGTVIFAGDKVQFDVEGEKDMGTFKLNPATNPKGIDWFFKKDVGPDAKRLGIYKIDGDTLTICWNADPRERPKEFKIGREEKLRFLVAKKVAAKGKGR